MPGDHVTEQTNAIVDAAAILLLNQVVHLTLLRVERNVWVCVCVVLCAQQYNICVTTALTSQNLSATGNTPTMLQEWTLFRYDVMGEKVGIGTKMEKIHENMHVLMYFLHLVPTFPPMTGKVSIKATAF